MYLLHQYVITIDCSFAFNLQLDATAFIYYLPLPMLELLYQLLFKETELNFYDSSSF